MADGPGGQMSYRGLAVEHDRRMRRTLLARGRERPKAQLEAHRPVTEVELIQLGGNYTDRVVGWVCEGIADEMIRRYNEGAE